MPLGWVFGWELLLLLLLFLLFSKCHEFQWDTLFTENILKGILMETPENSSILFSLFLSIWIEINGVVADCKLHFFLVGFLS